ncbi:MAG: iron ABC transporter permease, partial [Anaerolineae bacterium]|nr:iron ABC transporter permease [Anaerolineae bacterium]
AAHAAVISASLLVFLFDFTSFGVILILGGPKFSTLETEIYFQTIGLNNLSLAAVLSLLQLACTLAITIIYTRLAARLQRPLHLRPQTVTQRRLPNLRAKLLAGGLVLALLAFFLLPLAGLAARSFTRLDPERRQVSAVQTGFTLDYYRLLADNPRQSMFYAPPTTAIATSLGYAAATVALSLSLGLPAAWALSHHRRSAFIRFIDPLLMLPLGTSAVTLGLGFIVALNHPPLDLRASPLLIPLAHTLVAFPFVVRSLVPALAGIQPRLRHAAAVLGAAPRRVFLRIDLPLIGRALFVAAAFAFAISLGEFGASSLITRPEYPTMPVMIFRFLSQPGASNYGQALALSAILMAVTALGILAIERLRLDGIGEF